MTEVEEQVWYSISDAADVVGRSASTIRRWVVEGGDPSDPTTGIRRQRYRQGFRYRIHRDLVEQWRNEVEAEGEFLDNVPSGKTPPSNVKAMEGSKASPPADGMQRDYGDQTRLEDTIAEHEELIRDMQEDVSTLKDMRQELAEIRALCEQVLRTAA